MLVPLSWLKDYVNITLPPEELAEKLTIAGLEVDNIQYIGVPGGDDANRLVWDRDLLVVGQILAVRSHPNADKLVLADVDYGGAEIETVVTGAPNLFQYLERQDVSDLHLYSPFALEGAELYDGHKEGQAKMTLKGRKLRGIHNRCMLCSEKELGLSDDHEGIMIMEGEYTPGTPLQDVLGDVVLSIDIIPNIARCASIIGVAREVAALTDQPLRYPSFNVVQEGDSIEGKVTLHTENPDLNPRFVAMLIEGVAQKPSPQWLQRRLKLAGQRPINVVVDISNYVMLELGQPNHTFDYDFLRRRADEYAPDGPVQIITRLPHEDERVKTLDGETRSLPPYTILVTDKAGALSLGGIMGGEESEIGDKTTNVLLEAAAWNFINIRRSSTKLKLHSEAGFRFSRGVHPSQALLGAKRAAELLRQLAGGTVAQGIVDYYPQPPEPVTLTLTAAEVKRLGGIDLETAVIATMLRKLEFEVEEDGEQLHATTPDHRLDIEFTNDLVEEICRLYGYDRLPATMMADDLPPQRGNPDLEKEQRIKDILVQAGLQEIITYRLTSSERENRLLVASSEGPDERPYVVLANPITVDRVALRHSLLASALEIVADNSRFSERVCLFELSKVYLASENGELPDEIGRISLVMMGPRYPQQWQGSSDAGHYDFFDLKGVIEQLLTSLHITDWRVEAVSHPTYRPGHTARLWLGDQALGTMGELHPLVVEAFEIRTDAPVIAAELELAPLLAAIPERHRVAPVAQYPAVREDLALVVDRGVTAVAVEETIKKAGGYLLQAVHLFDLYEGKQVPAGKKSLAYHLTFQAPNRTLKDKDVQKVRQRILAQLERELGAKLR